MCCPGPAWHAAPMCVPRKESYPRAPAARPGVRLARPAHRRHGLRAAGRGVALRHALFAIDASSPAKGELRVLAWINHSFEDDLRQATATAEHPGRPPPVARQPVHSRSEF